MRPQPGGLVLTGGVARGAKLFTVPGKDIRPALARLRISVFEILRPRLEGATILDLFAGSGSMGLEALSRGARFGVFIDSDPRCLEVLKRNLAQLRFADRAEVVAGDALEAPALLGPKGFKYDLVFVDPPYAMYEDPASAARLEAAVAGLDRGEAIVEHRATRDLGESWAGGRLTDRRRYGGTAVSWYTGFGEAAHG